MVTTDVITDEMMMAGVLHGARITEYLVDWFMPWKDPVETLRYEVLEVEYDGDAWTLQVGSLMSLLNKEIGSYYTARCRVEVFSQGTGMCNKELSITYTETVPIGVVHDEYFDFEIDNAYSFDDFSGDLTPWADGKVLWLSGANIGHYSYVKQVTSALRFKLHTRTPFPVVVGDTATIFTGCNHQSGIRNTAGHCKNFYNNLVNFQGEPYIPGKDITTSVGVSLS